MTVIFGRGAERVAVAWRSTQADTVQFWQELSGWILGSVLGFAMCVRGLPTLHGSVVAVDGRAIGLLGVSGVSSDMRALLASDAPRARLAIDLYVYRIRRELGALAAAPGGLDAIVFTAGIGENAAEIRAAVIGDAHWLGARIDAAANNAGATQLHAAASTVNVWRVPTNEELMIARHTRDVLARA